MVIEETYNFQKVTLDKTVCIFASPHNEITDIRRLTAQFTKISEVAYTDMCEFI
jgi:hypothetical protein